MGTPEPEAGRSSPPPFPAGVLPPALRRYAEEGAAALGVPLDYVALPLLAFAGGAVGNTVEVEPKAGWRERPVLWVGIVAPPGAGKSPALEHAKRPLDALQADAWAAHRAALDAWEAEVAALPKPKKGEPAVLPARPVLEHFWTGDATTEALAPMLAGSPGVPVVREELAAFVGSMDAYRKGADRQQYLALWSGAPVKVDRRGADPIFVPRPVAPVVGTIQPDALPDLAGEGRRDDGFLDRFLLLWPDPVPQRWSEATVAPETVRDVLALFRRLRPVPVPEEPRVARLGPQARGLFAAFYDENAATVAECRGLEAGFRAKGPRTVARLALILHVLGHPERPETDLAPGTVADAVAIYHHVAAHLPHVVAAFGQAAPARPGSLAGRVYAALARDGGAWVARTDLSHRLGRNVPAEDLTGAMDALARAGAVEERAVRDTGGRPRVEYRTVGPDKRSNEQRPEAGDDRWTT